MRLLRLGRHWIRYACTECRVLSPCSRLSQKFQTPLPTYSPLFTSPEANAALERTIALHFLRTGQFKTAETFIEVRIPPFISFLYHAHYDTRNRVSRLTRTHGISSRSCTI